MNSATPGFEKPKDDKYLIISVRTHNVWMAGAGEVLVYLSSPQLKEAYWVMRNDDCGGNSFADMQPLTLEEFINDRVSLVSPLAAPFTGMLVAVLDTTDVTTMKLISNWDHDGGQP